MIFRVFENEITVRNKMRTAVLILTQRRRDTKFHFVILFNLVNPVKNFIRKSTQRRCDFAVLYLEIVRCVLRLKVAGIKRRFEE